MILQNKRYHRIIIIIYVEFGLKCYYLFLAHLKPYLLATKVYPYMTPIKIPTMFH